ncbi:hypothetical protein PVAP13_2KG186600 [Panicum virgatum]|uniref:F-box domain-containing protein n=1 Tax=Panicum virgatum TaxID=38727 RepID=A0A8T0VXG8_PANVG|nr:hypothetical protein PVAP13_2KG186600 [Panicum virgatum]
MEEIVEEILLRIPPDKPAHLVRAALVCKAWRRTLSDPGFLRRYRGFHRAPPLLGYLHNLCHETGGTSLAFVPTTAASPFPPPLPLDDRGSYWALDCRHGRVLLDAFQRHLLVWDPITGDRKELSVPSSPPHSYSGTYSESDNCIYKWLRQDTANGTGGWEKHMVTELETLLPRLLRAQGMN